MNSVPRLLIFVLSIIAASAPVSHATSADLEFFEKKVRPLLVEYCYECHSAEADIPQGDLRLDTKRGWLKGGASGPAVVPGDPDDSLLMEAVRYRNDAIQMPPDGRLTDAEIEIFEQWIDEGAIAPDDPKEPSTARLSFHDRIREGREFWAFRFDRDVAVPEVNDPWATTPIDAFIFANLREHDLRPSAAASKYALIRRASFDLIGLPPTPDEVRAFIVDESPTAFETVVERLLDSPHYGERWGRYWLDLARYADTNGADENIAYAHAWRYRDYVVKAFNDDKPYDRFVQEQLAGDLLPADEASVQERHDNLTATGFLVLGPKMLAEQDKEKLVMDLVDEQIDTIGQTLLGLTFGCSRCHDHKFDPISTKDYYALAGIFRSTKTMANLEHVSAWHEHELRTADFTAAEERFLSEIQPRIDELKQQIDAQAKQETERLKSAGVNVPNNEANRRKLFSDEVQKSLSKLEASLATLEGQRPRVPLAMGVSESAVRDVPVHIRGSHLSLADDIVPRGVPEVFSGIVRSPTIADDTSGRLEFAEWLTSPAHPLTSRVMVNRIWQGHFGIGLVDSASNFGLRGSPPSHPQLLDWLAAKFIRGGWSVKHMHRTIMLSNTYQMSVAFDERSAGSDPENRWLWRQNRRRLEAEPLRDALLAVSDSLDLTAGGTLLPAASNDYFRVKAGDDVFNSPRRAIYLPVVRNRNYEMFSVFDYSNPAVHLDRRTDTIVAQQALFLMNSPFVADQARKLAESLLHQESLSDADRLRELCLRLYARPVTASEAEIAMHFLDSAAAPSGVAPEFEARLETWTNLTHALLAANEFIYIN